MIRWVQVAAATAPGGAELRLMRRGDEYSITVDGAELMNSRRGGSELALGRIGCEHLRGARTPHVLIGGLGMGFTLRGALEGLGPLARITVAELAPQILDWARGALSDVFAGSLDDPRVDLVEADVVAMIASQASTYDAVLLDVDNGPGGLVAPANDRLYDRPGLAAARRALKPGGVLAVWSASDSPAFRRRLAETGFSVSDHTVRSGPQGRGARHTVVIARAS